MKKLIAAMLAVLMLAMPFAGQAEYAADALNAGRRVTFSVSLSDVANVFVGEPAVDKVIADILDALVISGYYQGDEAYYAIGMKQESGAVADLLTMGGVLSGDDFYLMSNVIGGTIVVAADEVVPVLERLIDMFVMMGFFSEKDARSIKAQLPEMWQMIQDEIASSVSTAESALNNVDFTQLNVDALMNAVMTVAGKLDMTGMDVLPRNCDTAASMCTLTLTPEEMKGVLQACLQFVKDNPAMADAIAQDIDFDNTIAPELSGVAGQGVDFMGFIDKAMAELAEADIFAGDVVFRMWMDESGMPVAMDLVLPIMVDGKAADVKLTYTRLTMGNVQTHSCVVAFPGGDMTLNLALNGNRVTATFAVAENGENRVDVRIEYTNRDQVGLAACDLVLDMTFTGVDVSMNAYAFEDSYSVSDHLDEVSILLTVTSDTQYSAADFTSTNAVTIAVNDKEYATVNILIKSDDPVASIMTGDVVRPAELNDADFANWFISLYTAVFSWAQNAMFAMPASLINLINTAF